ncbi:MAG TPA: hypothetical protein VIL07_09560 [Symbiobacteriaceae bacterium]
MIAVVLGITYGAIVGLVSNWLLFRRIERNRRHGLDPLHQVGSIFLWRYLMDAVLLFLFAIVVRQPLAIVASAVSLTVAVKISLLRAYVRKGGRLE